jgi:sorting nexin-27
LFFNLKEAEKLEPGDESSSYSYFDYSEKRSLPISIPDYNYNERNGDKYVVFNIYMAGRHLCSRRYREFSNLHNNLKKEFPDFQFPKLPGKWPFSLSDQQLDTRRRGLEQYLEKVCAIRVIAESDVMQEFLTDFDDEHVLNQLSVKFEFSYSFDFVYLKGTNAAPVDLKILLPDKNTISVNVRKNSSTVDVYQVVIEKIGLSREVASYFALFEIVEYGFERKLQPNEFPHNLYIQNYSTAASTCLLIKKWLFTLNKEIELSHDDLAETFFFWQVFRSLNF